MNADGDPAVAAARPALRWSCILTRVIHPGDQVLWQSRAKRESSRELYGGAFLVITRRWWDEYERGVWTERLLVDLLRRVLPTSDDSSSDQIPTYIIDHLLTFLADVLATKTGSHVRDAISQIKPYSERPGYPSEVACEVLSRLELAGT
jgi:hypothetical protein